MQIERSDEINLIRQTLNGKTSAFNLLVKMHRTTIYTLVLSYTKNPTDAEDLTQQIFIRAYERLATLRELDRFLPWLQRISHNTCKNWLRQQRGATIGFEAVKDANFAETAASPEEIALKAEVETVVREAISDLQETDRKLMEARYIKGASYSELQVESGLSYAAIVNRVKRAKQKVRRRIEKLLGGMAILPGQTLILGGMETVKLSAKVKLAAVGVAAVVGIGGGGVLYHRTFQSQPILVNEQGVREVHTATGDSLANSVHSTDAALGINSPTKGESISEEGEANRFEISTDDGVKIVDVKNMHELMEEVNLPEEIEKLFHPYVEHSADVGGDGKVKAALTILSQEELTEEMLEKLAEAFRRTAGKLERTANTRIQVFRIEGDHKLTAEIEELPEELKQKIASGEFVVWNESGQELPEEIRQAAIQAAIEESRKSVFQTTQEPLEEPKQKTANPDTQHLSASVHTPSKSTELLTQPTHSDSQVESPPVPSEPSEGTTPLSDEEWVEFEKLLSEFSDEDWAEFEKLLRIATEGDTRHRDKQEPLDVQQQRRIEKALEESSIDSSAREEMRGRLRLPIDLEIDAPSSLQEGKEQQDTIIPPHEPQ